MASWEQKRDELLKKYGAGTSTEKQEEKPKSAWEQKRDELLQKYAEPQQPTAITPETTKRTPVRDGASARKAYEKRQETAAAPIEPVKTEDTGKKSVLEQAMEYHQSKKDEVPVLDLGQQVEKTDDRTWFQKGALEGGVTGENVVKAGLGTGADATADVATGAFGSGEKIVDTVASIAPATMRQQMIGNYDSPAAAAGANIGRIIANLIQGKPWYENKDIERADQAYSEAKGQIEEFIKKDLYDEKETANKFLSKLAAALYMSQLQQGGGMITPQNVDYAQQLEQNVYDYLKNDAESDSVLGEKSDALLQSAGQLGVTAAASAAGVPWWLVSGATAYGSEVESALQQGATLEQANTSAAITAAAEILTEKISGGIKFGGKTLDDVLTKQISETITSKLAAALANAGVQAAGEGFEEILSDTASKFGQWLTYQSDKSVEEMFLSKEAFDQALEAFIGGSILGGFGSVSQSVQEAQSDSQGGDNKTDTQTQQPIAPTQAQEQATAEPKPGSLEWVQGIAETGKTTEQAQQKPDVVSEAQAVYDEVLAKGTNAAEDPIAVAVAAVQNGQTVSNKQATDILNNSRALANLRQEVGLDMPQTAAGRRNAVKEAINRMAIKQSNQLNIDNTESTAYNETTNGGEQNERAGGFGTDQERVSGVYEASGTGHQGRQESQGTSVGSRLVLLSPHARGILNQRGVVDVELHESSADNTSFSSALQAARQADGINGWAVTFKAADELDDGNIRTFMDANRTTGFGIAPDGDIVAVFANKTAGAPKGSTKVTMPTAIANGGKMLDCYGKGLVKLYSQYGFVPVAKVKFNAEYANDGWDASKGEPDIYFMMHNGDGADAVVEKMGTYPVLTDAELDALPEMDYDEAYSYRENLMSEQEVKQEPDRESNVTSVKADESVGAAPGWFDPNTRLQYEYGTLPEGENAVRPDDLPKRDYTGKPVSQTAVTVKGAKVTRDYLVDLLNKDVVEGGMSYVKITNDATVDKAIDNIMEKGWEDSLAEWSAAVNDGKAGADLVATGALLLNNAAKAGDKTAWLNILHDYQKLGTNTAQGLQAFRILKKLEPMDKLYMAKRSIKQMVKDMKLDTDITIDPELEAKYNNAETDAERDAVLKEIQKDVARQLPTTFMEKFTALRYLNMLGNLRTQGRNILGNLTMQGVRSLQNAIGTGLEALANKASGGKVKRTRSLTVSKEQMQAASKDFDKMQDAILECQKFDDSEITDGFARGVKESKQIFKFKPLEGYRKVTNWAMEKGDAIFARHAYARALAGYMKAQGITETDYSKIDTEIMEDARLFAAQEAQEATFRDSNAISKWVSKVGRRKDTPKAIKTISEGVVPFRKTPANVFVRAFEYSPLGVADSIVKSVKAAKGDSDVTATKVINSWAKSLTGTGLFGMGMLLASLGFLSAGDDEDENKEAFEDMNGWQNYALVLPDGTNLTIDSLSPAAIPILMGAEMMRLMQDGDLTFADLESALTSLADPMIEMSMLQGVNDAFDNIKYSDNNLIQLAISSSLNYLTQGLTNTLVGQIERAHEDQRMQTYVDPNSDVPAWLQRTLGKASAKIPVWEYNQIPYINAWGEQEENLPGAADWAYQMLSPSYIAKGKDDPLSQELNRLNDAQDENVYPAIQDKTITIDKQDYHMTADEFVEVATQRGQMQKKLVEGIINSKDYNLLSDEDKAKAIKAAYTYARETALGDVIKDHPGLSAKWMQELKGNISEGIIRHIATGTNDKYTDLSVEKASFVTDLIKGIKPEGKAKSATPIQKIEAVTKADNKLTAEEQQKVIEDILDDKGYAKYLEVLKLSDKYGSKLDNDDYAASYRIYLDEDKKGGTGQKDRTIRSFRQTLEVSQAVAKKLYEIYS